MTTTLNVDEVLARGELPEPTDQVIFQVEDLYGVSDGARFPLNRTDSFDTGPMGMSIDSRTPASTNLGIVDFERRKMRVRYGVEVVFPGLHDLVTSGRYDLELLGPLRATATDECTLTDQLDGWRALGCLEMLPGSMWSGAKGG